MNRFFSAFAVLLLACGARAAEPMSRVVEVIDSSTLVVQTNGISREIRLRGLRLDPNDEVLAVAYLRVSLREAWVLIDGGDVYRSPDGLHINDALNRRLWTRGTYLGTLAYVPQERDKPAAKQGGENRRPPSPRGPRKRRR